jgi:hypothetical protein
MPGSLALEFARGRKRGIELHTAAGKAGVLLEKFGELSFQVLSVFESAFKVFSNVTERSRHIPPLHFGSGVLRVDGLSHANGNSLGASWLDMKIDDVLPPGDQHRVGSSRCLGV